MSTNFIASNARLARSLTLLSLFVALLFGSACGKELSAKPNGPPANKAGKTEPKSAGLIALPNSGFEEAGAGWDLSKSKNTARIAGTAAFEGKAGLRIDSPGDDRDASVSSKRIRVKPGQAYRLAWQGRVVSGGGTNVYLRFFDATGKEIQRDEGRVNGDKGGKWGTCFVNAIPPREAVQMDIFIQRPNWRAPVYVVDLDAFELTARPISTDAPWPGTYKLRAEDTKRLTAADVIGPDGIVYPDFTWAGVPGGIARPETIVQLADLGARANEDISSLLESAASKIGAEGGGVIALPEGTFHLDRPVFIFANNVVIRGEGAKKTKILFRYHVPMGEILFLRLKPGQEIGPDAGIEFHANPANLIALELRSGGKSLSRRERQDHWGNTFSLRIGARQALGQLGAGPRTFTAIAEYADGTKVERSIDLRLVESGVPAEPPSAQLAAINFVGRGAEPARFTLQKDTRRGSRTLILQPDHTVAAGDKITLIAPASERWKNLLGSTSTWGIQAQTIEEVKEVDGDRVVLRQPLRVDFRADDGAYVQKVSLISGCGVEGLQLEQVVVPRKPATGAAKAGAKPDGATEDLWTSGVVVSSGWGCWLRDVTVRNTGRNAAYFPVSKHIEVRDCVFEESLFKRDGGTGYVGFDRTWDSLMDNVEVRGMRHAPNNQWNAAGNVIRNSRFFGSDGQWHAGWTLENLYENNFIDARGNGGSYGHGLYASGPWSGLHGPQGPRNVVYNNDVVARLDCLHMLGGNEAWIVLHNRFVSEQGRAVYAREKSFDHIISDNVFVLKKATEPVVFLGADSAGVELTENRFYGTSAPLIGFAGGLTKLASDSDNTTFVRVPEELPERPQPKVPSIFQWQRDHLAEIRAAADERAVVGDKQP